jgi:hypothetical protein
MAVGGCRTKNSWRLQGLVDWLPFFQALSARIAKNVESNIAILDHDLLRCLASNFVQDMAS